MRIIELPSSLAGNAIGFAYVAMYGRNPPAGFLPSYTNPEENNWGDLTKDIHLQNDWIERLNNIKNINILSTCEGHGRMYFTHIIIQLKDNNNLENYYDSLCKFNEQLKYTKSVVFQTAIGPVICLTTYDWYRNHVDNNEAWSKWWENIILHLEAML